MKRFRRTTKFNKLVRDHPYFSLASFSSEFFYPLPPLSPYPTRVHRISYGTGSRTDGDRGSCDVTDDTVDPPPYLALARGAFVVGVLPGATAVVNDASVTAGSGMTRNREPGAVHRHLSCTGIVLAARATIALLGHGIRAGYRWTFHLPAVYFAVLQ